MRQTKIELKKIFLKNVPQYIFEVAGLLAKSDYEAYLVGGAVRDIILGRKTKDYDIATNALPEDMVKIFPKCVSINARFGTITVLSEEDVNKQYSVEVTTYRKDSEYFQGRWPEKIEFSSDISSDLSRRDFTINAMAVDLIELERAGNDNLMLVDPFDGMGDLENKIIKAVNDPMERFSEDGLRAFRACRIASELDFEIETNTFNAIKKTTSVASLISKERIRDEFNKILAYSSRPSKGLEMLRLGGLLEIFIPELTRCISIVQPDFHQDNVYIHSLKTMDMIQPKNRLAALLHDLGKYSTGVIGKDKKLHFYGHDQESVKIAKDFMERMKYSNEQIKKTLILIKHHMFYYPTSQWRKEYGLYGYANDINFGGWSDSAIRRFMANVGEENLEDLFDLRIADAMSNPKGEFDIKEIQLIKERINKIRLDNNALKISDLAINGDDLISLGVKSGPDLGKILKLLLTCVLDNPKKNNKEELLREAKNLMGRS